MFQNLTVKTRLVSLISLMTFIVLALTISNLYSLLQTKQSLQNVSDRTVPLAALASIKSLQLDNRLKLANTINDPTEITRSLEKIAQNRASITEIWKDYTSKEHTPEEEILISKFVEARKNYAEKALDPTIELLKKGETETAQQLIIEKLRPLFIPVNESIIALVTEQQDIARREYDAAQNRFQQSVLISIVSMSVGLVISLFSVISLIRHLSASLKQSQSVNEAIANGNLNFPIEITSQDEFGQMLNSSRKMQETLSTIISSTTSVMEDLAKGKLDSRMQATVQGDFIQLKESINKSLDNIEETLADVVSVANALANGDLSQKVTKSYKGVFGQTTNSINYTVDELRKLIEEIDSIVYSGADCGNFSVKMTMHGKVGYG